MWAAITAWASAQWASILSFFSGIIVKDVLIYLGGLIYAGALAVIAKLKANQAAKTNLENYNNAVKGGDPNAIAAAAAALLNGDNP